MRFKKSTQSSHQRPRLRHFAWAKRLPIRSRCTSPTSTPLPVRLPAFREFQSPVEQRKPGSRSACKSSARISGRAWSFKWRKHPSRPAAPRADLFAPAGPPKQIRNPVEISRTWTSFPFLAQEIAPLHETHFPALHLSVGLEGFAAVGGREVLA